MIDHLINQHLQPPQSTYTSHNPSLPKTNINSDADPPHTQTPKWHPPRDPPMAPPWHGQARLDWDLFNKTKESPFNTAQIIGGAHS